MKDHLDQDSLADPEFQSLLVTCLEKLERGETLDRQALLRKHSKFAQSLAEFLDNQMLLKDIAAGMRDSGAKPSSKIPVPDLEATMDSAARNMEFTPGEKIRYIGEYEILEEIARGGMGVVFKARQQKLNRIVALKMILSGRLANDSDVERFQLEARAAGALKHPNIVAVHDIGEYEGRHYFTMDFVEGRNLSEEIRDESLAPRRAAQLIRSIAEAVHYAHSQGTLHRDLKPANILIGTDGVPQITDFGLAKIQDLVDDDSRIELTATGQILGTPSYMSPEQAAGKTELMSPASDTYSLGSILYACLTGRAPFVAGTPVDTLLQVINNDPASPRLLNPLVPKDLETICLKCLAKERHKRYATAQELADDLGRFLDERPVLARPVSAPAKAWRWAKRNRWIAALSTLSMFLLVAGAIVSAWFAVAEHSQRIIAQDAKQQADDALIIVDRALDEVELQRDVAEKARHESEQRREELRRQLYVAQIAQAQQSWLSSNISRMRELLDRTRPDDNEQDLRGFEWYYLSNLLNSARLTIETNQRIADAVVSPAGDWVATLGGPQVNLWNLDTGDRINSFEFQVSWWGKLAASPDGKILAAIEKHLTVWDLETNQSLWTMDDLGGTGECIAISPDSKMLAVAIQKIRNGVREMKVQIFASDSGTRLLTIDVPVGMIFKLVFDPTGSQIAGTCHDAKIRFWDTKTGVELSVIPEFYDNRALAYSPDGKRIAYGSVNRGLRVVDVNTGEILASRTEFDSEIHSLAFHPDGQRLIAGGSAQTVNLLDAVTLETTQEFRGHEDDVMDVQFRHGRFQAVSTDRGGDVKIWDLDVEQGLAKLTSETNRISDVCFSPDGKWLACAEGVYWGQDDPGSIELWNTTTGEHQRLFEHSGAVMGIAFFPDGQRLVSVDGDGLAIIWDLESFQPLKTLEANTSLRSVRLSGDGRFMVSGGDGQVLVWDLTQDTSPQTFSLPGQWTESVSISSDGRWIAGCHAAICKVWNRVDGTEILQLKNCNSLTVAFNHAGDVLAIGLGRQVSLYETSTWDKVGELIAHRRPVEGLAFNPNDQTLVTRSDDGTVKLWDRHTLQLMLTLNSQSHPHHKHAAVFNQTGELLFADHPDHSGMVRMWSTRGPIVPPRVVDLEGLFQAANSHCLYQRWELALNEYEPVLEDDQENVWARVQATQAAYMAGDPTGYLIHATAAFELAQELREQSIQISARLVGAASLMPGAFNDFDTAIEITTQAWKELEHFYESRNLLFVLNQAGHYEELLAACEEMATSARGHRDTSILWHFKSIALYHLERIEEANECLSKAVVALPKGMPAIGRGRPIDEKYFDWFVAVLAARNEADQVALEKFNALLTADPDNTAILSARAQLHFRWHRWEDAAEDFQQLAQLNPADPETLELAAMTALLAGQDENFQVLSEELEQMLNAPENSEFAWSIARMLSLIPDNIRDEEKLLTLVQENAKKNRVWWSQVAVISVLYRAGKYEAAAALIEPTMTLARDQRHRSVTLLWQSMLQWHSGDEATARKSLTMANALNDETSQPAGVHVHGNDSTIELIVLRREAEELIGNVNDN